MMSPFVPSLWITFKNGYHSKDLFHDLISGITVGVVTIPLAMAFAIAAGASPVQGLYTAIIAGFLAALFGGSKFQISGPTGAFVVIIYSIIQQCGYDGLVVATFFAGLMLIGAGATRLGAFIQFIPYPLVTGFTTGIAVLIFVSQMKDFFGLQIAELPAQFFPKVYALGSALPTIDPLTTFVAAATLLLIVAIRSWIPTVPWGIVSIVVVTAACSFFQLPIDTIWSRFGEIPNSFPLPRLPDFSKIYCYDVVQGAVTIAFLAGIESLLSAVVADGMTGKKHRSNSELVGQGIANIGSVLFGGIPATGAIARTAMNVRSGARSALSAIFHSITLLLILFYASPLVSQIPLAALSAVLVMVAWNMSEIRHFRALFNAPKSDVIVLLTTFFLTVVVDLVVAIEVGVILSMFLFMKRMRDLSGVMPAIEEDFVKEKPDPEAIDKKRIPSGVEVYEIMGVFFFGLADTLNSVLSNLGYPPKVFILRMRKIPVIDASGMQALREFYHTCKRQKTLLMLSGVNKSVKESLKKFGLVDLIGSENIFSHIDPSIARAIEVMEE